MKDLSRYDGTRALVVGCATGMGAATADALRLLGAEVHGVDVQDADARLAGFTRCDLRDPGHVATMLDTVAGPIDSLFYCAGLPPTHPPIDVMKVNFAAMRAVVDGVRPLMPRGSSIAIVSSTGGLGFLERMGPIIELLATDGFDEATSWCMQHLDTITDGYMFSKEAIIAFTMKRAVELVEHGVRVNCISPGPTATPMMPDFEKASGGAHVIEAFHGPGGRKAQPDEMAWPLVFLNSRGASFVNGTNLVVDGGMLAGVLTGAVDVQALLAGATAAAADRTTSP